MSKHTPGPWIAEGPRIIGRNGRVAWLGFGHLRGMGANLTIEEQSANAALIAAAPDLLEALVECVASLETVGWGKTATANLSREVIKKAKGE